MWRLIDCSLFSCAAASHRALQCSARRAVHVSRLVAEYGHAWVIHPQRELLSVSNPQNTLYHVGTPQGRAPNALAGAYELLRTLLHTHSSICSSMGAVQILEQILEYLVGREYLIRYFFQILQYLLQILQYLLPNTTVFAPFERSARHQIAARSRA